MPSYNKLVSLGLMAALILSCALPALAKDNADRPAKDGEVSKNQKPPRSIKQVEPQYPLGMALAGLIGEVKIELIIDKEGNVPDAFVQESNNPWFERAAIDAVMQWKFEPAEVDGQRVYTRAMQLIEFRMDSRGEVPELWRTKKGKDHDKLPPELRWHTAPVPKLTTFPVYPFELLKAGARGKVRISYVVGPDGRVVRAKLQSADLPEFGAAVLAMIDAWRFEPAKLKDGTPCYANLGSEYEFIPNGRGGVPVADNARHILHYLEKQPGQIVPPKDLDQPLKPRSRRPPAYPTALAVVGQPGEALIEFYVDREGDVQLPKIISSSAPEFGYAAVQAVATWRFDPPKKGGKRVVVCARIPINFAMDEHKDGGTEK
jgi:TonB family protein